MPATLDWTLERAGDHLNISYSLTNRGKERIYVADDLLVVNGGAPERAPDRLIVAPGDSPDLVRFVRGIVEGDSEVEVHYAPAATHLDPGQSKAGTAQVPLPVRAWHNYAPPDPLPAPPTKAVLEIAVLTGSGEWGSLPLASGGTVTVPQLGYYFRNARFVKGEVKALP